MITVFLFLFSSLKDKTIKLWKISERDKRPEGYNLKEEDGRYRDFNTVTTLRVCIDCFFFPLVHSGKQQLRLFSLSFIHSIVCTLLESQNWIDLYSILLNATENRALK